MKTISSEIVIASSYTTFGEIEQLLVRSLKVSEWYKLTKSSYKNWSPVQLNFFKESSHLLSSSNQRNYLIGRFGRSPVSWMCWQSSYFSRKEKPKEILGVAWQWVFEFFASLFWLKNPFKECKTVASFCLVTVNSPAKNYRCLCFEELNLNTLKLGKIFLEL